MKAKITKQLVETTSPGVKDRVIRDTTIPGFGVKITPAGSRTYFVEVRLKSRRRRITLGRHGDMTTQQARERAEAIRGEVALGGDPTRDRDRYKGAPTLKEFSTRYMREHVEAYRKPKTIADYRWLLDQHLLPTLGHRLLADIELADVRRLHLRLRDRPTTANRTVELLSAMLNRAAKWGLIERGTNPCRDLVKYREIAHERYLTELELARLGRVLDALDRAAHGTPAISLAISLLITTGARRDEIRLLRWENVDLERGLLVLPDSKTGRKVKRLGGAAIQALANAPRESEWVTPALDTTRPIPKSTLEGAWRRIRLQARIPDVRLHDLRHTFASFVAGERASLPQIGALLGQTSPAATQRYAHLADDPLRIVADRASDRLARLLDVAAAE